MTVARPENRQVDLVYAWESPLSANEEVIVGAADRIVTMQHGQVLGIFEPGNHRLPGEIPPGVELWFCSTRPQTGKRFGGKVAGGLSVFGDYEFAVREPHRLVLHLAAIGTGSALTGFLDKTVMGVLGEWLAGKTPEPPVIEAAKREAEAEIDRRWAEFGVKFLSFGSLHARA